MVSDTFTEEVRHLEVRVAELGRDADNRRDHLCIERAAAVAYKHVRLLLVTNLTDKPDGIMRVEWKVRSYKE